MKKINNRFFSIIVISLFFLVIFNIGVFAKENKYLTTEEYSFNLADTIPKNGYIKIFIGKINGSDYQNGYIKINPKPNSYDEDEFGNKTAVYNIGNEKGSTFKVVIEKYTNITERIFENEEYISIKTSNDDIYLKSYKNIESDNNKIIQKAKELTQNCNTDYEKLKNIFEFVNLYITYDTSVEYRNKGALSAFNTKRGVCEEYSTLFTALCRASNIPSRVISGFRLSDSKIGNEIEPTEYYHSWAEVYLKDYGWVPFELSTEYTINNVRTPYWDGFLGLGKNEYVLEGVYNDNEYHVTTTGVKIINVERRIKLLDIVYFNDINNHWAKKYISNMYENQIVKGYEDNSFKPNNQVSRIEFMIMLKRALQKTQTRYYNDVAIFYPSDFIKNWATEEYEELMGYYAYELKDISSRGAGYNTIKKVFDGKIDMNKPITREEVAALVSPFLETMKSNLNLKDISYSKFIDEINNLVSNGVITGYEDKTYKPDNNITRAETCTILQRFLNVKQGGK